MPKRKTRSTGAGHLPAGFVVTTQGFPKAWSPTVGDELQGTVHSIRKVSAQTLKYDNAKKGQMVTIVSVADGDGEIHGVFESKALEDFCGKVKIGDEVFLRLDDVRKIGKKQFKDITAAIKAKKGK
jgi:hypothetical protein